MAFELPALPYDYEALTALHVQGNTRISPRQASQGLCRQRQQAGSGSRHGEIVGRGGREAVVRQERRALQQRRPALQPHPFLEVDEKGRRRHQAAGASSKRPSSPTWAATTSSRPTSSQQARRNSARAGPGSRSRTASLPFRRRRMAKIRSFMAARRSWASMSGNIPTTSTTATRGRNISRLSSTA